MGVIEAEERDEAPQKTPLRLKQGSSALRTAVQNPKVLKTVSERGEGND